MFTPKWTKDRKNECQSMAIKFSSVDFSVSWFFASCTIWLFSVFNYTVHTMIKTMLHISSFSLIKPILPLTLASAVHFTGGFIGLLEGSYSWKHPSRLIVTGPKINTLIWLNTHLNGWLQGPTVCFHLVEI